MLISGIQKFTLLDYPGKTACVVFTPGCNFRCGYCHNSEFVLPELINKIKDNFIPEKAFFNFLKIRRGLLEGVVITGGEPTIQADLIPFIKKIKALGFLVKLDTNGNCSSVIRQALEEKLLDYIAMDIKTSLNEYQNLAGKQANPINIRQSIELIKNSGIDYEFRTTLLKQTHNDIIIKEIGELLQGSTRYFLQTFRPGQVLDPKFVEYHAFTLPEMEIIAEFFRKFVQHVEVRV